MDEYEDRRYREQMDKAFDEFHKHFEARYCSKCNQVTNHSRETGKCQKCLWKGQQRRYV